MEVGPLEGTSLGELDGMSLGDSEGSVLGTSDGDELGISLGLSDGSPLGISLGLSDGSPLGTSDGDELGTIEGISVCCTTHEGLVRVFEHIPVIIPVTVVSQKQPSGSVSVPLNPQQSLAIVHGSPKNFNCRSSQF